MIKIAVVDDEFHVLERFERMISGFEEVELCGVFETGEDLIHYLSENTLDAVFLDIEMPQISGLELSHRLLDMYEYIDIVFVTAYNQYAVDAFELNAVDYVLKPLTEERLTKTIHRLLKNKRTIKHQDKPLIQCIGDFEIFVDHEALLWKNSKAKEILAFLVQKRGVPVNWEKISDAIWPEYNSEKAQTNFHANMYLLRKRLAEAGIGKILECGRGNYRILTEYVTCDLDQLDVLLKENRIKRREDLLIFKQLKQKGYMFASGYSWAMSRAAELEEICDRIISRAQINHEE